MERRNRSAPGSAALRLLRSGRKAEVGALRDPAPPHREPHDATVGARERDPDLHDGARAQLAAAEELRELGAAAPDLARALLERAAATAAAHLHARALGEPGERELDDARARLPHA